MEPLVPQSGRSLVAALPSPYLETVPSHFDVNLILHNSLMLRFGYSLQNHLSQNHLQASRHHRRVGTFRSDPLSGSPGRLVESGRAVDCQ
jgi:hypothetical protein